MAVTPDDPVVPGVVKRAVLREAAFQYATGRVLANGEWVDGQGLLVTEKRMKRDLLRSAVETLLFWLMVAVLGLGLMGLALLVL